MAVPPIQFDRTSGALEGASVGAAGRDCADARIEGRVEFFAPRHRINTLNANPARRT